MDTGKVYLNSDDNERTIHQMIKEEPQWAANRVQEGEKAIERVKELESKINLLKTMAVCDCCGCMAIDDL